MRTLKMTLAILAVLALLAGCGAVAEPVTTTEPATEAATTTAMKRTTEPVTTTEAEIKTELKTVIVSKDLLDFVLIDHLFSMTFADFCREEGHTVEMEGNYGGSSYCRFSKYGPAAYFWFDYYDGASYNPETDLLKAIAMDTPDLVICRQTITLSELKQWLEKNDLQYRAFIDVDEGPTCYFSTGNYIITTYIENDIISDKANIHRIFVKPND